MYYDHPACAEAAPMVAALDRRAPVTLEVRGEARFLRFLTEFLRKVAQPWYQSIAHAQGYPTSIKL
jgi:hypothetical protein